MENLATELEDWGNLEITGALWAAKLIQSSAWPRPPRHKVLPGGKTGLRLLILC